MSRWSRVVFSHRRRKEFDLPRIREQHRAASVSQLAVVRAVRLDRWFEESRFIETLVNQRHDDAIVDERTSLESLTDLDAFCRCLILTSMPE